MVTNTKTMSNNIKDLLNQLPDKVSVEQHYHDEQQKLIHNEKMIAVFCRRQRDFEELEPTPRKIFRRIKNINDLRGIQFTGIIKIYDWYREKDIEEAYDYLKVVQPELFD